MSAPRIDGFADLTRIGGGANGTGYRATQVGVDRAVAIKVLSSIAADPNARERFAR